MLHWASIKEIEIYRPLRVKRSNLAETIGAAAPSENIDPAEDTPLQPAAPIITITTPQPTTTTTNATTTSTPAVAEPAAVEPVAPADVPEAAAPELDLAALFAKMSPEDQQALLAQAAQPAAVSTEVCQGYYGNIFLDQIFSRKMFLNGQWGLPVKLILYTTIN